MTKILKNDMLNKVPEITLYFWIIKVLCTTVGETASDFLNESLNLGLNGTSVVMGALLAVVLYFQFRSNKYIPGVYWLAVVLVSIFGTLITDILTDKWKVPLETTTIVFSVALALTFAIWYAKERTLSIHTIFTSRREAFYWLAILFTFALGTAAGDLASEKWALGYLVSGIIFCAVIAAVGIAWRLKLNPVLAFWIAYIMTRPVGASLGDYLSQATTAGGVGLGPTITTGLFLLAILMTVIYLSVTKRDLIVKETREVFAVTNRYAAMIQTAIVVFVLVITGGSGYYWHQAKLRSEAPVMTSPGSPLGDLSVFRQIAEDTLGLVRKSDLPGAKSRITDLESAWDKAEERLKPVNFGAWTSADKSIDRALRQLRSARLDGGACCASLETLIAKFYALDKK